MLSLFAFTQALQAAWDSPVFQVSEVKPATQEEILLGSLALLAETGLQVCQELQGFLAHHVSYIHLDQYWMENLGTRVNLDREGHRGPLVQKETKNSYCYSKAGLID
ncbi:UNVERIFIED_CONTAM: hypothetical protein K2H54_047169 [Gekko kuhli]